MLKPRKDNDQSYSALEKQPNHEKPSQKPKNETDPNNKTETKQPQKKPVNIYIQDATIVPIIQNPRQTRRSQQLQRVNYSQLQENQGYQIRNEQHRKKKNKHKKSTTEQHMEQSRKKNRQQKYSQRNDNSFQNLSSSKQIKEEKVKSNVVRRKHGSKNYKLKRVVRKPICQQPKVEHLPNSQPFQKQEYLSSNNLIIFQYAQNWTQPISNFQVYLRLLGKKDDQKKQDFQKKYLEQLQRRHQELAQADIQFQESHNIHQISRAEISDQNEESQDLLSVSQFDILLDWIQRLFGSHRSKNQVLAIKRDFNCSWEDVFELVHHKIDLESYFDQIDYLERTESVMNGQEITGEDLTVEGTQMLAEILEEQEGDSEQCQKLEQRK